MRVLLFAIAIFFIGCLRQESNIEYGKTDSFSKLELTDPNDSAVKIFVFEKDGKQKEFLTDELKDIDSTWRYVTSYGRIYKRK